MRKLLLFSGLFSATILSAQTTIKDFIAYEQPVPASLLNIKMTPIPAGSFTLGNNNTTPPDEKPAHKINISAFWMGVYEITHDQYDVFFKDELTSVNADVDAVTRPTAQYIDLSWDMGRDGGYPANSMSQYNAMMFCRWLYKNTGIFYRLPTEAEWEYAANAGSAGKYYFGNDSLLLNENAWYAANAGNKYQMVGQKKPNAWGLYDMLGNLTEWTLDHYSKDYYSKLKDNDTDPVAEILKTKYPHTLKGGSYHDNAADLYCSKRWSSDPSWNKRDPQIPKSKWWLTDGAHVGFRIIRPLAQPSKEEAEAFYKKYLGK